MLIHDLRYSSRVLNCETNFTYTGCFKTHATIPTIRKSHFFQRTWGQKIIPLALEGAAQFPKEKNPEILNDYDVKMKS